MTNSLLLIALGLIGFTVAAGTALADNADLKVSRVALFSSGVGYFECDADVTDAAEAELKFRTAQINDILKSLVVQDLDGGTVSTIGYASQDPLEKRLKSFGVDIAGKPTLGALLDQLRGEAVEVARPRTIRGVILGVEKQQIAPTDKGPVEVEVLTVFADGALQQMRLDQIQGIKLTNEKVGAELSKALAALAASHDADRKSVLVRFEGKGRRHVRAAYLLEAPIWKTSYRMVLAADKKPFLQGWATVENATEEDWKDVRLSLVSGRPISFTMDLYTPLYVPRPQEELELYASLRPPEYAGGFAVALTPPPPAASPAAAGREVRKGAAVRERVAARAGQPQATELYSATAADALTLGDQAGIQLGRRGVESVAKAQAAGELFEYAIATPVSIGRQRSAMLAIANQEIGGRKVSIFNPATHPKYPLNGLEVENTTGLNLMQGPVTIFDENIYAGDAKLPDLRPGEKRLVGYALDLAVEVMTEQKSEPAADVSLRIAKGTLVHRHRFVDERTYNVKNKDKKDRTVLLEQAYSDDWTLLEPKQPYERAPNLSRFKVEAPAGKTVAQKIVVQRVADEAIALAECGLDQIQQRLANLTGPIMSAALKEALQKVIAMRTDLDRVVRERGEREKAAAEAGTEQGRVRENVKVLEKGSDVYQRQVAKLDTLETSIEQLRGQIAQLRKDEETKRSALQTYLLALDVE